MKKEMLINTVEGQECRIAILDGGVLEELYIERASNASHVGNIYKGRVNNIEPGIQAAFVDFGFAKNGFLHVSDVHPQYFPKGQQKTEPVGRKRPHRERPPIQDCLRRGQEVLVQMTKEGIGTKGPTLTTYLSIPGRCLVLMPGMSRLGVSRKIEDDEDRAKARAMLDELDLPDEMGFILRTAGLETTKRDLKRDLNYLVRLWQSVQERIKSDKAPAEIYQESDLVIRTLRDIYNSDIQRVICDSPEIARKVDEFLRVAMPRGKHRIECYTGSEGLFHESGLEEEIERMYSRRVELKSGGSLVIDQTEALVAIDVNSGRFRKHSDAETTATKMNLEAAGEITRQLRLRDLGGVIVIDFIDMRDEKNRRKVEKALRDAVRKDRAKTKVLRMSSFGIVEMTRQRVRPSLKDSIYDRCSACDGTGLIKSAESQAMFVLRQLQRAISNEQVSTVTVTVTPAAAHQLSNHHRAQIAKLEADAGRSIVIKADPDLSGDEINLTCTNNRGSKVSAGPDRAGGEGTAKIPTATLGKMPSTGQSEQASEDTDAGDGTDQPKKSRRRRHKKNKTDETPEGESGKQPDDAKQSDGDQAADGDATVTKKKRRRRGGRRHRKRSAVKTDAQNDAASSVEKADTGANTPADKPSDDKENNAATGDVSAPETQKPDRRPRRRGRQKKENTTQEEPVAGSQEPVPSSPLPDA